VRTTIEPGLRKRPSARSPVARQHRRCSTPATARWSRWPVGLLSPQPPGSIFKVITTTAGLEQKKVKLDEYFEPVSEINPDPENGAG
jgi:hypothetical protein